MDQADDFASALLERIRDARSSLREAAESNSQAAMSTALDELERGLMLARENGIDVPAATDGPGERDGS
ncbi:vacuolar-type H+-ATPase subunit E/Vma4 [Streptacidiphilus sp. MAP12-33]|uniref:hypothetical protein n=1 Tax=Streptacidiphilus sp. MAP12-33 TaxID=3156266 RepID=UPI003515D273